MQGRVAGLPGDIALPQSHVVGLQSRFIGLHGHLNVLQSHFIAPRDDLVATRTRSTDPCDRRLQGAPTRATCLAGGQQLQNEVK